MCDSQIYNCFCSDGHLELHTLSLLPSQRQVVFKGDRLPFHCTAALVDKMTTIHWRHNGQLVTSDPEMGVQLEGSVLHDCTFITRYLNSKCSLSVYFNFSAKAFMIHLLSISMGIFEQVIQTLQYIVVVVMSCLYTPSSELILFNVHVEAKGEWECVVSTGRGNTSRSVEIVVLENSASFCPEEKVVNNRGEFRLAADTIIGICST